MKTKKASLSRGNPWTFAATGAWGQHHGAITMTAVARSARSGFFQCGKSAALEPNYSIFAQF
jgi:hypothetical protein